MEAIVEKPSLRDQQVANASLAHFAAFHQKSVNRNQPIKISLPEQNEVITIPRRALELLEFILASMAEGKAVSLLPADAELSTQQAADRLHISRPHFIKLLEQGLIPFRRVGSHRRVQVEHLLRYEQQQAEQRQQHLQFLARQAQELSLGYE